MWGEALCTAGIGQCRGMQVHWWVGILGLLLDFLSTPHATGLGFSGLGLLASASIMQQSMKAEQALRDHPVCPTPRPNFMDEQTGPERRELSTIKRRVSGRTGPDTYTIYGVQAKLHLITYGKAPFIQMSLVVRRALGLQPLLPRVLPRSKEATARPCPGSPGSR